MASEPPKKPAEGKGDSNPGKKPAAKAPAKKSAKKPADVIRFRCPRCTKMSDAPIALAGRFSECTECKQRTPVPESQEAADDEARDYGVIEHAYDIPDQCMRCGKKMKKNAVICVNCGFNYKEGKQIDVIDTTIKAGEKVRGGPALQFLIAQVVFFLAGVIYPIVRHFVFEQLAFWELGLAVGIGSFCFLGAIGSFRQWDYYRTIPIRKTPTKEIEDRAEKEEASSPLGKLTPIAFLACVAVGMGLGYLILGMEGDGVSGGGSAPAPAPATGGPNMGGPPAGGTSSDSSAS